MSNINALLTQRLKKNEQQSSKMAEMAKQSASGNLTSFSGVFSITELTDNEKSLLGDMLTQYALDEKNVSQDLKTLISITSEVKAINNQAALLHGERIKKAQAIFNRYKEGAFSSWLITTYGNRQTPYNLMQYYEFYESLPKPLRPQIESMPRQAVYTLASRDAPMEQKQEIVKGYSGQTKSELLAMIREAFPLVTTDRRKQNLGESAIQNLRRIFDMLRDRKLGITRTQKNEIYDLMDKISHLLK